MTRMERCRCADAVLGELSVVRSCLTCASFPVEPAEGAVAWRDVSCATRSPLNNRGSEASYMNPIMSTEPLAGEDLERRLEELLRQDRFASPAGFLATERVDEASVRARAGAVTARVFWAEQARGLEWDVPFTTVLDESNPPFYKWFADGKLNVSYNCLDRHVEAGRGGRVAFYWAGENGEDGAVTYAELHRDVQLLANGLKGLGVGKGDVVGIFLPMIPEVVVAMLACARIGAPHNVVFGGFAVEAVRERMEVSNAKALITVDGARRKGKTAPVKAMVDATMGGLMSLEHIVVVRHTGIETPMSGGRDVFYDELLAAADPVCCPACRWRPSIRCSFCTPRGRPRRRRGSCTPPAAI